MSAAGFAGCGGTVNMITGGTGGGDTTTHTVTTSTTTSSSSTSTSTSTSSSSSSSSGNTPCDKACTQLQMCTGFTCSMAGLDCSTLGSQFDCVANCISNTPCSMFGFATLQKCQAQCAGGGDGGAADGGTDGGMMFSPCTACIAQGCTQPAIACGMDATCQKWLVCAQQCNQMSPPTVGCFQACDAMYPSAQTLFDPVYACTCSKCSNECSATNPCAYGMDGGP